ncbi:MAG: hypothetical protein AMJ43_07960 [Coxiella sp. DG_40]|nr:MAG: hypothetical protein AMJ43_07960 [Coxiella sp. DG_40]
MAGRKKKFQTEEEMQDAIDKYFKSVDWTPSRDEEGRPIPFMNAPTITELALALGFADRRSLYDYLKKDVYTHTIKSAISKIESLHEKNLISGRPSTGSIFWLKNVGWQDKTEAEEKQDEIYLNVKALSDRLGVSDNIDYDGKNE